MKNSKYKILIDDKPIITYDNVILDNDLLYKKSISETLYNKILIDTHYYDIYNKCVNYILKRRRSEKEIIDYLSKFDINQEKKDKIINKLKEIGLINDIEFSRAYINDKIYLGNVGINKIKQELLNHNIQLDTINNLLCNIDNDILNDKLEKIIAKKIKLNSKKSNKYLKQKILNDMINLGYDKEEIIKIIDSNIKDDSLILNQEFEKVYKALSKKYNGYELKNKIKQKLSLKGFSLEKINVLLEKNTED